MQVLRETGELWEVGVGHGAGWLAAMQIGAVRVVVQGTCADDGVGVVGSLGVFGGVTLQGGAVGIVGGGGAGGCRCGVGGGRGVGAAGLHGGPVGIGWCSDRVGVAGCGGV